MLAPLASDTVATIVGFTEVTRTGRLHNTAAVFHKGSVVGLYRKLYPAMADVVAHAREVDIALATEHGVSVVRADVAGRADGIVSYGSSGIVGPSGRVLRSAQPLIEDLIVADLAVSRRESSAIQ